jgi:hypothetical protein
MKSRRHIFKDLVPFLALALSACTSTPRNPQAAVEREVNACLPAAITMREGLVESGVWSEVLLVHWLEGKKARGHAYAVYLYPPAKNQLWAYDRDWGSIRVRALKNDARAVALAANNSRALWGPITSAEYLQ